MVDHLTFALVEHGVRVELFNLTVVDIGKLAMALVDAATVVVGVPTVLAGPHHLAAYATLLANALRPKAKFLSIFEQLENERIGPGKHEEFHELLHRLEHAYLG